MNLCHFNNPVRFAKILFWGILMTSIVSCSEPDSSSKEINPEQPSSNRWERFTNIFDFASAKAKIASELPNFNTDGINFLEKNELLYSLINGYDKTYYDSLLEVHNGKIVWDSLQNIQIQYGGAARQRDTSHKIFGWHPFWMGSAYKNYQFDLLSYVSWFSYDIDPETGGYEKPNVISELRETELIQDAQKGGCNVLLTLTNHGKLSTKIFLDNFANQQYVLIDSALALVKELGLNGLDLNFENIYTGYGAKYTAFIKAISVALKKENPDYILSLTLQKINGNRIYDIASLNDYVDIFVLTGYDFHYAGSKTDGPIAPLRAAGNQLSLEGIVNDYLDEGVETKKLILALPFYGGSWIGPESDIRSTGNTFKRHYSYRSIQANYSHIGTPSYDNISNSAYYKFETASGDYEKLWFDDSTTLDTKFQWIKEKGLAGVGIWALGYDNGRQELWNVLDKNFAADTLVVLSIFTSEIFNVVSWLSDYQIPIFITALFYVFFVGLGFFISLFDWRVRNYLFANKSSRLIFILSIFGTIAFVYMLVLIFNNNEEYETYFDVFDGSTGVLILGLILGGVLCGFLFKLYKKHRANLP